MGTGEQKLSPDLNPDLSPNLSPNLSPEKMLKTYGIALTGGIGTGKSTVADMLRARSYEVIDADQLARNITAPGSAALTEIANRFGADCLNADGSLNRKILGSLVFQDSGARRDLEAITHPRIRAALLQHVDTLKLDKKPRPFFYEAALIFETTSAPLFRTVWATYCPPDMQAQRIIQRDGVTAEQAATVVAAQMSSRQKADLADVTIDTSGTPLTVAKQLDDLLKSLKDIAPDSTKT